MAIITLNNNSLVNADVGKVLQVVTGTSSTFTATTSTSYVATNLSASITPASTSNKIFIVTSGNTFVFTDGNGALSTIFRDSTDLSGNKMTETQASGITNITGTNSMSFLDSPNTTSSLSYSVRIKSQNGDNVNFIGNSALASITLMEIQA